MARAVYELDPHYQSGEYVDGFQVSPGGAMSWEQALQWDAEFGDDPRLVKITKFPFAAAVAALEALREPSGAMVDAAWGQMDCEPSPHSAEAALRAAIDAAIAEKDTP